jgi:hypothetical protein
VLPAHTIGLFTSLSGERKKLIKQKRRFADLEKRVLACVNFRLCFAKEEQKCQMTSGSQRLRTAEK